MYIRTAMGMERVNVQSISSIRLTKVKDPEYDGPMFGICIEQSNSNHNIDLLFIDRHDADDFMENMCSEIARGGSAIIDMSGLASFVDHDDIDGELAELHGQELDSEEQSSEE